MSDPAAPPVMATEGPLLAILDAIRAADPRPWYFQAYAREAGLDPKGVGQLLELLWLEELIVKSEPSSTDGPGVRLSLKGMKVAEDTELRHRLRTGKPLTPGDRGGIIRESLYSPSAGRVTKWLVWANFAVFAYSLYLANAAKLLTPYLMMQSDGLVVEKVMHPSGGVSGLDILRGEWWRVLTSTFAHGGLLHIIFNMYAVWGLGKFAERIYGPWRYLSIYLVAGWGGSCLALALSPTSLVNKQHVVITGVGASGALCGVLAASAVWVLLNGKYLPREMAKSMRSNMFINCILITVMSMIPGVSAMGHLGGAILGAAAALVLHVQRFGGPVMAYAMLPVLAALPAASWVHMQAQRPTSPGWQYIEEADFQERYRREMVRGLNEAAEVYPDRGKEVVEKNPTRRDPVTVEKAREVLSEAADAVEALRTKLATSGPYTAERVNEEKRLIDAYAAALADYYRELVRCLDAGNKWTRADDKELEKKAQTSRAARVAYAAFLRAK